MTDRLIRHLTTAAVLLVAALAATVSYVHIRDLAITHGGDRLTSALLPLLIDGTVAAMSCVMLRAARLDGVRTPWLARFMLGLSVGATLAANMAYGAAFGLSGALLWTCPAVFFVGCVEVSVAMVRRTRPVTLPAGKPAEVKAETAAVPVTVREAAPKPRETVMAAVTLPNGHKPQQGDRVSPKSTQNRMTRVRRTRPVTDKSEAERSATELPALASGPGIEPGDLSASQGQSSSSLSPGLHDRMHPVTARPAQPSTSTAAKPVIARPPGHGDRVARLLASSPQLTVPEIARKAGVSQSTVARRKRDMRKVAAMAVNGNGKAH